MISRKIFILSLIALLLPLLTVLMPLPAEAAHPTITIDPIDVSETTLCLSWASSGLVNTDDLTVVFENSVTATARFDVEALTAANVTFYYDSSDCGVADNDGAYQARVTETGGTDANDQDKITIINRALSAVLGLDDWVGFSINLDPNTGTGAFTIADATPISIGIASVGTNFDAPIDAGNYKVLIEQTVSGDTTSIDWLDTQLLYIGEANLVDITATLDPSISLSLLDNSLSLGVLSPTQIETKGSVITITTNIGTGYTSYIEQDHSFQTTVNGSTYEMGVPTNHQIEASGLLGGTYGEYGLSVLTDDTVDAAWHEFTGACTDYDAQSSTALPANEITADDNVRQVLTSYTTPVNGVTHGLIGICFGARISYDTPPGVYSHTITITVVGNF